MWQWSRRQLLGSFVLLLVLFGFSPNVLPRGDSALSVPTVEQLLTKGNVDLTGYLNVSWVEEHYALTKYGDQFVDYFPWQNSIGAAPLVLLSHVGSWLGISPSPDQLIREDRSWVLHYVSGVAWAALATVSLAITTLAFAARLGVEYRSKSRLGILISRQPLLVFALAAGISTQMWSVASRSLSTHGQSMFFASTALGIALQVKLTTSKTLLSGLLLGWGIWIRPEVVVVVVVIALLVGLKTRTGLYLFCVSLASTVALVGLVNMYLFSSVRPPYFVGDRLAFHDQYLEAVAANLVSPARGLLVYCPFVVAAVLPLMLRHRIRLTRETRIETMLFLLAPLAILLLVSAYPTTWWAGHTYGPRFLTTAMLFLFPLSIVGSLALHSVGGESKRSFSQRGLAVAWIAASILHWQGGWLHATECWNGRPGNDIDLNADRVWEVADSQLLSGFRSLIEDGPTTALVGKCLTDRDQ